MDGTQEKDHALRLNVGSGRDLMDGWINIDHPLVSGVDVQFDLETCGSARLPFDDNTVSEIRLFHVIEHIHHVLPLMEELYRVAQPGCQCTVRVPHGSSDDAWTDPTHVRPYFPGSFDYFSQPFYWRADYGYRGDWQAQHIYLLIKNKKFGHLDGKQLLHAVAHDRNMVQEIVVKMEAIKPIRPQSKELRKKAGITLQKI